MHSLIAPILAAGLASFAQAYTTPGANTWGPLLEPDLTHPITQGKSFTVTWDPEDHPTDDVTVSLVLCQGPSTNCVPSDTAIASGIPASQKSYDWEVPCDLAPGTQNTASGYGMMVIVDGTGEFQYSTQFSCLASKSCSSSGSSSSNSTGTTTTTSGSSVVVMPPTQQTGSLSSSNSSAPTTTFTGFGSSTTGSFCFDCSSTLATIYSTASDGSVVTASAASTITAGPAASTVVATGTSSAPASTFTGGAVANGLNGAGMALAGAVALFAL
ncbi:hypothetical protein H2202_009902 [Exophiala xenobiotica]|nr:hypothetical protein H2202_009902 [Exophiala xenobiotica]KAK5199520.1 hypothetical protein LTR92_000060 [Exophiala xenobiotica]KAK5210688.1 hypothetical protein LTR41_003299 [Exophiala xenobiotica]KAK5224984.1 hypothetical protein LTR72_004766 [Exophiala xenobiotica]KAK5237143.1 hypothetical protein LTR47_001408 [Exophiala xenobiotica]